MSLKAPRRLLIGFSLLAVISIGGLLGYESRQAYEGELSNLEGRLEAETTLLAEQAQMAFSMANRILRDVTWKDTDSGMQELLARLYLYERVMSIPQFAGLIVTDAKGQSVYSARKFAIGVSDFAERDFFTAHREGAQEAIGRPFGEVERRVIPVSTRLNDAQGRFAGVAMVLLDSAYFQRFYAEVSDDSISRIGMFHRDGTALSLYPAPFAELPSSQEELAKLFASHDAQALVHVSPLDGTQRISSYRRLDYLPVTVTASYDYRKFLASLYPFFLRNGLIFLFFITGIGIAVGLINRAMRDAYQAREAQLGMERQQQDTLQLCHAIARHLPNGRVFVLDRELRYVFVEGQHWQEDATLRPEAMIGKTLNEVYPLETRRMLQALVEHALAGSEADREVAYQARVYKTFATPLADDDGRIRRCLLLSQDITQFKEDQAELERLNTKLRRLASCDGLLSIANRREFDRVIELEWRRASRDHLPLGLLLIDVDYFKIYNDTYGHLEGDACLQQIAAVLREAVGRPGDLVARYGGEEMVALLPDTGQEGALHLAQRIHAALAKQAIPFPDSPVAGHVTVSIGVASLVPDQGLAPATLIERADEALYAAKDNGRNRTEHSDDAHALGSLPS